MLKTPPAQGPIASLSRDRLLALIAKARQLQLAAATPQGLPQLLRGKNIALLSRDHAQPSARAFEQAATSLGAKVARVPAASVEPGHPVGLLGRLYDAIECQDLSEAQLELLARSSVGTLFDGIGRPQHPSAVIADLMSVQDLEAGLPFAALSLRCEAEPSSPAGQALAQLSRLLDMPLQFGREQAGKGAEAVLVFQSAPSGMLPLQPVLDEVRSVLWSSLLQRNRHHLLQAQLVDSLD